MGYSVQNGAWIWYNRSMENGNSIYEVHMISSGVKCWEEIEASSAEDAIEKIEEKRSGSFVTVLSVFHNNVEVWASFNH